MSLFKFIFQAEWEQETKADTFVTKSMESVGKETIIMIIKKRSPLNMMSLCAFNFYLFLQIIFLVNITILQYF